MHHLSPLASARLFTVRWREITKTFIDDDLRFFLIGSVATAATGE